MCTEMKCGLSLWALSQSMLAASAPCLNQSSKFLTYHSRGHGELALNWQTCSCLQLCSCPATVLIRCRRAPTLQTCSCPANVLLPCKRALALQLCSSLAEVLLLCNCALSLATVLLPNVLCITTSHLPSNYTFSHFEMTANEDDVDTNRGSEKGATNPLEGADVSKKRQRFQLKEPPGASKKRGKPQRSQHLQLNHSTIHWDNYDTDFPRHGRQGEDEIYNFLQRLEKNSNFPAIRANATGQLLEDVRTKNKIEILRRLQAAIPILPPDDIILLQDGTSLRTTLDLPFEIPLLYRNFSHRLGGHLYSIQDFLAHLQDDQAASISVYDYSIEDPEKRTRNMTVGEVCLAFEESVRGPALNFLDIENRTTIPFCPHGITSRNIKTRIDSRTGGNKGKTGSRWNAERQKEFFLLAQKNAISPTHIDTDGKMTWVLILQGWKVWYFPRRVTTHILRWLAQVGSQVSAYFEGGWIKVVLRAGDLL